VILRHSVGDVCFTLRFDYGNSAKIDKPMHWLLDVLIDVVGCPIARLVLPLVSFGRIYVEPLTSPRQKFNMFGYRRDQRGRIELHTQPASFIGLVILVIAISLGSWLIQAA